MCRLNILYNGTLPSIFSSFLIIFAVFGMFLCVGMKKTQVMLD